MNQSVLFDELDGYFTRILAPTNCTGQPNDRDIHMSFGNNVLWFWSFMDGYAMKGVAKKAEIRNPNFEIDSTWWENQSIPRVRILYFTGQQEALDGWKMTARSATGM